MFGIDSKHIHRLEELKLTDIQESAEQLVCVYRDKLMPLFDMGEMLNFKRFLPQEITRDSLSQKSEDAKKIPTLIVARDERYFGLCIESFVDIAIALQQVDTAVRDRGGILGNVFIGDISVCVVGIEEILKLAGYVPKPLVVKSNVVEFVAPPIIPLVEQKVVQKVEMIEDDGILWVV